jgi:ketosteroid isomerase-like protein
LQTVSQRITRVQAIIGAINDGRWQDAFTELPADFVYDLSRTESPLRGVYRGIDEVQAVASEFFGAWESLHYAVHEVVERGDEVVVPYTSRFRSRQGIQLEAQAVWVMSFRGDEMTRLTLYQEMPA